MHVTNLSTYRRGPKNWILQKSCGRQVIISFEHSCLLFAVHFVSLFASFFCTATLVPRKHLLSAWAYLIEYNTLLLSREEKEPMSDRDNIFVVPACEGGRGEKARASFTVSLIAPSWFLIGHPIPSRGPICLQLLCPQICILCCIAFSLRWTFPRFTTSPTHRKCKRALSGKFNFGRMTGGRNQNNW